MDLIMFTLPLNYTHCIYTAELCDIVIRLGVVNGGLVSGTHSEPIMMTLNSFIFSLSVQVCSYTHGIGNPNLVIIG